MEDLIKEVFFKEKTNEKGIDVKIKFNLGKLNLSGFYGDKLYELDSMYPNENYTPIIRYSGSTVGILHLESQKIIPTVGNSIKLDKIANLFNKDKSSDTINSNSNIWDLKLNKDLPMEIYINGGASKQNLELGGMRLKFLNLLTGVSSTKVNFDERNKERMEIKIQTGASSFEAKKLSNANIERMTFQGGVGKSLLNFSGELLENSLVEIQGGLGIIELEIPENIGVKVGTPKNKLLSIDKIPKTFTKKGDLYINSSYEENKPYLTIRVNSAMSSLSIKEI